jgi:16S rRNA (adenine1518-N6/adenine1519-N6)-dimethyltransferase
MAVVPVNHGNWPVAFGPHRESRVPDLIFRVEPGGPRLAYPSFIHPRDFFRLQDARPRKRFGQHFLVQPKTAERIVGSADLDPEDVVVEVGPGLGALTQFILPRVRQVHLVELDRELADYLETVLAPLPFKTSVHQQDILDFDLEALSRKEGQPLVVLGNLPYNISSMLVFCLLETRSVIKRVVVMVQREVGERLAAKPGTKQYGVLSVLLGVYARVHPLFSVAPAQFYPPPQVDSLVLSMDFNKGPEAAVPPLEALRQVVNISFQQRRKTLQNSLKGMVGGAGGAAELLAAAGIDPQRRPETLAPEEFVKLATAISRNSSPQSPQRKDSGSRNERSWD